MTTTKRVLTSTIKPIYTPEFYKKEEPIKKPAKLWHAWWEANPTTIACHDYTSKLVPKGTVVKDPPPFVYPTKEIAEQKTLEIIQKKKTIVGPLDPWKLIGIFPIDLGG